ncbi:MAG: hypothetical protein CL760_01890 [Chloroflexi bacterium]|nr:hypothetical protein [Chloroflexota bacterium]
MKNKKLIDFMLKNPEKLFSYVRFIREKEDKYSEDEISTYLCNLESKDKVDILYGIFWYLGECCFSSNPAEEYSNLMRCNEFLDFLIKSMTVKDLEMAINKLKEIDYIFYFLLMFEKEISESFIKNKINTINKQLLKDKPYNLNRMLGDLKKAKYLFDFAQEEYNLNVQILLKVYNDDELRNSNVLSKIFSDEIKQGYKNENFCYLIQALRLLDEKYISEDLIRTTFKFFEKKIAEIQEGKISVVGLRSFTKKDVFFTKNNNKENETLKLENKEDSLKILSDFLVDFLYLKPVVRFLEKNKDFKMNINQKAKYYSKKLESGITGLHMDLGFPLFKGMEEYTALKKVKKKSDLMIVSGHHLEERYVTGMRILSISLFDCLPSETYNYLCESYSSYSFDVLSGRNLNKETIPFIADILDLISEDFKLTKEAKESLELLHKV